MSLSLITLALTLRNILLNDSSHRIHLHYTPPRMLCLAKFIIKSCVDLSRPAQNAPTPTKSDIHKVPN